MDSERRRPSISRTRRCLVLLGGVTLCLLPGVTVAQGLTGALIGTVKDAQGGVLSGAVVRVSSPALIGGPATHDDEREGAAALPGSASRVRTCSTSSCQGFATYHEEDIRIGAGATHRENGGPEAGGRRGIGRRSRARARASKRETPDSGRASAPRTSERSRRGGSSMFDFIRAAPGISPTSPSSGTATTVSAFGSGTNENQFLIDGTNFTCPCNGVARAEPGVDFIQEIQVQSVGASAEFGNVQGAVINVITRQGSERFLYDASYYGQTAGLTSQPVRLPFRRPASGQADTSAPGTATSRRTSAVLSIRDRLWFFAGYQYLRDYDSQPGTDPTFPRTYEQDKIFAKLTWQLAPGWQLVQSVHDEFWVNPEQPTFVKPFEATLRQHASVPAITFGHLTHTLVGQHRVGCARRTVRLLARGRPEHRRSDDAEPVRPRDGRHRAALRRRSAG